MHLHSLREVFLEYALRQTIRLYEKEDIAVLTGFLSDMERAFRFRAFVAAYDQMVRCNLPVGQCNEKQVETKISR